METTKHTPRPWTALTARTWVHIRGPNGEIICQVTLSNPADAPLIAAAPDLLDALENIEANLTGRDCFAERVADSLRRCKEAIARATGQQ